LIYFFASLFIALAGFLVFPGYYFRLITVKTRTPYVYYFSALRQAILLSVFIVGLLILKATDSLNWWDGLLLFVALFFLEIFFRG
jgi:ABC-type xylose transport system permease subunit